MELVLRAVTSLMLPVVVLGEFDDGIRQSRHYRCCAAWLDANLGNVDIVSLDGEVCQEGVDRCYAHVSRMALAVEEHEAASPADGGLAGIR